MAACAIEDTVVLTSLYCPTTNPMKPSSSFEALQPRYPFNFHVNSISMDATALLKNPELTKKRHLNRSHTYTSQNDLTGIYTIDNCSAQAVPTTNNELFATSTRPKTLLLNDSKHYLQVPLFRTCLSHPSTAPNEFISIDDDGFSPQKFTSLPVLKSPPPKRLRPQTLPVPSTGLSVPALSKTATPPSSISFLHSTELAATLQGNSQIVIFDCGSPFRFSENHILKSTLLRVSDKISRKRLKSNPSKHSTIDAQQFIECDVIILYDDNNDNDQDLSAGIKCACEEIQRCLTNKCPPIFILINSFEYFLNLYPDLCESLQPLPLTPDDSLVSAQLTPGLGLLNYPMTHILDGIFIGSESNAKNLEDLSSENIRYIVNVTSHVPLYHSDHCHYYHIPADDTQKQNLIDYFDPAYRFIFNAIQNKEKVLVHCVAGISRSPAIVISFLMRYAQMNMNDAYQFVKNKRSIVSPNLNFMGQLLQYEKRLREDK